MPCDIRMAYFMHKKLSKSTHFDSFIVLYKLYHMFCFKSTIFENIFAKLLQNSPYNPNCQNVYHLTVKRGGKMDSS